MGATILHEAPSWLAVDKPAGIVTVPGRAGDPGASLWRVLERERGERLWAVHRLDRGTSGVVLFARDAAAHRELSRAFEEGRVVKTYLAWVRGRLPAADGVLDAPIHAARKGKMRPATEGEAGARRAVTRYRILRTWKTPAGLVGLVEARPETGRQHQIRVHLRWAGAPLLVDPIYGGAARFEVGGVAVERLTLHASRIELQDPVEGRSVAVVSPLPDDLGRVLRALDRL